MILNIFSVAFFYYVVVHPESYSKGNVSDVYIIQFLFSLLAVLLGCIGYWYLERLTFVNGLLLIGKNIIPAAICFFLVLRIDKVKYTITYGGNRESMTFILLLILVPTSIIVNAYFAPKMEMNFNKTMNEMKNVDDIASKQVGEAMTAQNEIVKEDKGEEVKEEKKGGGIFGWIKGFFGAIWGFFTGIVSGIWGFFKAIVVGVRDWIYSTFLPPYRLSVKIFFYWVVTLVLINGWIAIVPTANRIIAYSALLRRWRRRPRESRRANHRI